MHHLCVILYHQKANMLIVTPINCLYTFLQLSCQRCGCWAQMMFSGSRCQKSRKTQLLWCSRWDGLTELSPAPPEASRPPPRARVEPPQALHITKNNSARVSSISSKQPVMLASQWLPPGVIASTGNADSCKPRTLTCYADTVLSAQNSRRRSFPPSPMTRRLPTDKITPI